jgi:hypothetical protein
MFITMIKLIYSTEFRRRSPYVVFYDRPNRTKSITTRSFDDIKKALDFACDLTDLYMGNVDSIYMNHIKKTNHRILEKKCWDFA